MSERSYHGATSRSYVWYTINIMKYMMSLLNIMLYCFPYQYENKHEVL